MENFILHVILAVGFTFWDGDLVIKKAYSLRGAVRACRDVCPKHEEVALMFPVKHCVRWKLVLSTPLSGTTFHIQSLSNSEVPETHCHSRRRGHHNLQDEDPYALRRRL